MGYIHNNKQYTKRGWEKRCNNNLNTKKEE